MSILKRFKEIMSSNINALLDKCEDPAKMVDQTLRNLREDLAEVRQETASVMANEKSAKRKLDECDSEIARTETAAKNALTSGNEDDARTLIARKQKLVENRTSLQQTYDVNHANAVKMRQMHDKLTQDITDLEDRKDNIKAKLATAKAQEHINQMTSGVDTASSIEAFDRMEAKADQALDKAIAESELVTDSHTDSDLVKKYTSSPDASVEEELQKMKADLGL